MYNLEVEAEHCYFVGESEALGHNTCGGSPTDSQKGNQKGDDGYGIVYLRTDGVTGEEYVGQAKSKERFDQRQQEHRDQNPGGKYTFTELERVPNNGARSLDAAEEDWIRAGGGPKKQGGDLANKRYQMSDKRYNGAGGSIGKPTSRKRR